MQLGLVFEEEVVEENKIEKNHEKIKEFINRRRNQILVHSTIYYRLNSSIIDDYTFDMWAKELAEAQNENPKIANECRWNEAFKDFTGNTGYDLPIQHPWAVAKAIQLLEYHKKHA
jgi:hypothetical protein